MKEDFFNQIKITVDEMRAFYAANFPFEANNRRVGMFAKEHGYVLTKQMKNRKYERFYIKESILNG